MNLNHHKRKFARVVVILQPQEKTKLPKSSYDVVCERVYWNWQYSCFSTLREENVALFRKNKFHKNETNSFIHKNKSVNRSGDP